MSRKSTSRKVSRRAVLAGTAAGAAAALTRFPAPAIARNGAVQTRPADGQDRAAGARRHPDGAGHHPLPEGAQVHARRPQGRAHRRRYRRQPRRRQDQGAGARSSATASMSSSARSQPSSCWRSPTISPRRKCRCSALRPLTTDPAQAQSRSFCRASATSSQCNHPLADYAAKEMKLKRMATISEDFAFGYEQAGGFQRVSRTRAAASSRSSGRRSTPPTTRPSWRRSRMSTASGTALPDPIRCKFNQQYAALGLKAKYPICVRLDRLRRRAPQELRRRGGGRRLRQLVFERSRYAQQQGLRRRHGRGLRQHPRRLRRGHLHQRHVHRSGAREDGWQDRGQEGVDDGAPRRRAQGHAARPASSSTISATSSATSSSARSSAEGDKLGRTLTRPSRPTPMSASSGPMTRRSIWRSPSIRATIRRWRSAEAVCIIRESG